MLLTNVLNASGYILLILILFSVSAPNNHFKSQKNKQKKHEQYVIQIPPNCDHPIMTLKKKMCVYVCLCRIKCSS